MAVPTGVREGRSSTRSGRSAGQPAGTAGIAGADAVYRTMFDSFDRDKDGRVSHWEVLSRLQRSGLQPDDPRIADALAGCGRGAAKQPELRAVQGAGPAQQQPDQARGRGQPRGARISPR